MAYATSAPRPPRLASTLWLGASLTLFTALAMGQQVGKGQEAEGTASANDRADSAQASAQNKAAQRHLDIWEFQVMGNTLLQREQIEAAVSPYLGPERTVADIDAAANNLERAFRDAGYPAVYVSVPQQTVAAGVVKLKVVEGKIERVRVVGSRYFLLSDIRDKVPSAKAGVALHVPTLQGELRNLNAESGDLKVTPILRPGKIPGAVDIDLKVKDELPLHGSLELNNYNSVNTTHSRLSASLSYDNLWQMQHSLTLQWQEAPEKPSESQLLGVTYVMPWFDTSNRFALYAIKSDSDVASVGDISVIGAGKIYGTRFVMPLPSTRKYIHSLSLGIDYKDYSEIIRLDPANKLATPIDYAAWSFQYNAAQFTPSSQTQWIASANFGIRGIGNSDSEFIDKRNHAHSNYVYFRGSMVRSDYLPADWILVSTLRGQWANAPLINNEELSAGGEDSVRGYYESQALGDSGGSGGLELKTPRFFSKSAMLDDLRLFAFIEGARLRVRDPMAGQQSAINLASTGLGFELKAWHSLDFSFDWARLLKNSGDLDNGDQRVHAGMNWKF